MRRTRHTILTAIILLAGCATDDNRLGGQELLEPGPDAGASGGASGAGSGGSAGSGGTGNPTGGSGGIPGADLGPPADMYTAFVAAIIVSPEPPPVLQPARCMPRPLHVDEDGKVPCVITQATYQPPECGCTQPGTRPAPAGIVAAVQKQLESLQQCGGDTGRACESYCLCQLDQFTGAAREQCLTSPSLTLTGTGAGWCYIDAEQGMGDPALVDVCPANHRRKLRFGELNPGAMTIIACSDRTTSPSLGPARSGAIGEACIPSSEAVASFSGFSNSEVSVELGSRQCSSGLCLANHFRGRVTCPYGQDIDPSQSVPSQAECFVPGSGAPVALEVDPQDSERRSMESVYCSCRCAGPGPGPFCPCPQGYSCTPLVDDMGLPASSGIAGSYCIKQGTEYDGVTGPNCERTQTPCE
jgi:hypothetical protein